MSSGRGDSGLLDIVTKVQIYAEEIVEEGGRGEGKKETRRRTAIG